MTVLVALAAPQALRRRHASTRAPPRSARSRSTSRRASRSPSPTSLKGALIQSANDAADALALVDRAELPGVRGADEREGGGARPAPTRTSSAPTASTRPASTRAPRDVTRLALDAMQIPRRPRRRSRERDRRRSPAAATLHTWNDLLGVVPGRVRRQDRPHRRRRLVPGRGGPRRRRRRSTRRSSAARRGRSATPTSSRCSPTGSRSTASVDAVSDRARLRDGDAAVRPRAARARRARRRCAPVVRVGAAARPSASSRRVAVVAAGAARARCSATSQVWRGGTAGRRARARRDSRRSTARARGPRRLVREAYSPPRRSTCSRR